MLVSVSLIGSVANKFHLQNVIKNGIFIEVTEVQREITLTQKLKMLKSWIVFILIQANIFLNIGSALGRGLSFLGSFKQCNNSIGCAFSNNLKPIITYFYPSWPW